MDENFWRILGSQGRDFRFCVADRRRRGFTEAFAYIKAVHTRGYELIDNRLNMSAAMRKLRRLLGEKFWNWL